MQITGRAANLTVQDFKNQLMAIENSRKGGLGGVLGVYLAADKADVQKLTLIRNFPIPNSIGDSSIPEGENVVSLQIGNYSIDEEATAWLNGNKLFQRHAVIVGSTGSGKSWCVAKILEQVASLKSADAILFDIHGEYSTLQGDGFSHLKVAGPSDTIGAGTLFLPYWLLTYEEMLSLMLDRSDNNAPNQAMMFSSAVIDGKKQFLIDAGKTEMEANITLDSPIPYNLEALLCFLRSHCTEPEQQFYCNAPYQYRRPVCC